MLKSEFKDLHLTERKRIIMPKNIKMRLNRLERPEPWHPKLLEIIKHKIDLERIQQYPSYNEFYEQLSDHIKIPQYEITIGAGIEEFIRTLYILCVSPGDGVVFLYPTCAMFEIYAQVFGAEVLRIQTDPNHSVPVKQIISEIQDGVKLVILANPGQPVETLYDHNQLEFIAAACLDRRAILAIDEAYYGFGAPTSFGLHHRFENVVILRTFSKAYGGAALRLGYAVAGPVLTSALHGIRQSGEVSDLSMAAASGLMVGFDDYVRPGIEAVAAGRDWLRQRLTSELGLRAWGQYANHVLVEMDYVLRTTARLADRGVLVKSSFPAPLHRHMLVTAGPVPLMEGFFEELKAIL